MEFHSIKGALSTLRQILATESPLNMMKNAIYYTLKALLVLKIFKFVLNFQPCRKTARLERQV